MLPKVSVVIPTYNRANVLGRAVKSVQSQTYQDFEIIIVDDCSDDGTPEMVASYNDPRIKFIRHDRNKGGNAARNSGVRASIGEFVAFLDSDDEWQPAKLKKQLIIFDRSQVGLVYCGFTYIDEANGRRKDWLVTLGPDYREDLLVSNFIGTTSVAVVRRDLLEKISGFDEQLKSSQDWDLYLRLRNICDFGCVKELLVNYYIDRKGKRQITTNSEAVSAGHGRIALKFANEIAALPKQRKLDRLDYLLTIYIGMAHFKGVDLAREGFALSAHPKYLLYMFKIAVKHFAIKWGLIKR